MLRRTANAARYSTRRTRPPPPLARRGFAQPAQVAQALLRGRRRVLGRERVLLAVERDQGRVDPVVLVPHARGGDELLDPRRIRDDHLGPGAPAQGARGAIAERVGFMPLLGSTDVKDIIRVIVCLAFRLSTLLDHARDTPG